MRLLFGLLVLCTACTWFQSEDQPSADDYEGNFGDECTNGVDEDEDGLFDCDDESCKGSPDCDEAESMSGADTASA